MPKVYLTEAQKRDDDFRRLVAVGLASSGVRTQKALSEKMNMKPSTMSAKLKKPDNFRRDELRALCRVLRIDPAEMGRVL